MSQSNLCPSCIQIFNGTYCSLRQYLKSYAPHIQTPIPSGPNEWRISSAASDDGGPAPPFHRHHTVEGLSSSRHLCSLCALVWEWMTQPPTEHFSHGILEDGDFAVPLIRPRVGSGFVLGFMYMRWNQPSELHLLDTHDLMSLETIDMSLQSSIDTWLPTVDHGETALRIKNWLQEDDSLSAELAPNGLPTRLIRFCPPSSTSPSPKIQVVESKELSDSIQYAALSHCWGEKHLLKHVKGNSETLYGGIALSDVPKTFRDAIELAHSLDIEYVWIDSICIIQDSKEDWDAEATRMASIYLGAAVTIAAVAAEDSSTGTIFDSMLRYPVHVTPTWTGFEDIEGGLRRQFRIVDTSSFSHQILRAPLNQRGWVYQERILSFKTIYCAKDQLWWASSLHSTGYLSNETCRGYKFDILSIRGISQTIHQSELYSMKPTNTLREKHLLWRDIVQEYMTRHFTFQSDRLIALAGIATAYQRLLQIPRSFYLAGLWRETLLNGLLWDTNGGRRVRPPQLYRGPSWSWVSMEPTPEHLPYFSTSFISKEFSETQNDVKTQVAVVQDAQAHTMISEFGPVKYAFVVLQGPLIKAHLSVVVTNRAAMFTPAQRLYTAQYFPGGCFDHKSYRISLIGAEIPAIYAEADDNDDAVTNPAMDDVHPSVELIERDPVVYLALIEFDPDTSMGERAHALVLKRGVERGDYVRIGYARVRDDILFLWKEQGQFEEFPSLEPDEYLQLGDEPGIYTYRIV